MKKGLLFIVPIIASLLITFIFFEGMSWYHLGDVPTKTVLIRMLGFFFALSAILIGIVFLIAKKKSKK